MQRNTHFFRLFIIGFLLVFKANVSAQTYSVQASLATSPPYFNYLSHYADQNNHLQVVLTLLDFNNPPINVRLRVRIEGPGYELYTNPNVVVGQPLQLQSGVPLFLTDLDLQPYLQESNLIISPSGLDINNLPEGFTTICVDVILDGTNQEVISSNNCTSFILQRYTPSIPFYPNCESILDTNQMYSSFTWTDPMGYTPDANTTIKHTFKLYRWNDPNNYSIFQSNQGLVTQETVYNQSMVQIPLYELNLENGGLYVWRVESEISVDGMPVHMIENDGVSIPCTFYYGEPQSLADVLTDGLYIDLNTDPLSTRKGKAYWTVIDNTPNEGLSTFDNYLVEYRRQPTGNESYQIPWFADTVTNFNLFIYQLEPSTTYEVKVSGIVGTNIGDPTPVETFTTPDPRVYACGEADLPFFPTNWSALQNAQAGIQVQIGQFLMNTTQLQSVGMLGHYSGKGTISIPFLMGAKAQVTFDDILIDTEYLVREGRVDVVTQGLENWLHEQYAQFVDPIYVNGVIDSAYVDSNGVAWAVVDGVAIPYTFDPPDYPIILNDNNGNQYTIYPNDSIEVSTYVAISEEWDVDPDEVAMFSQSEYENLGFDPKEHMQWHENYEIMRLADSSLYFVANKSMAEGEADVVNVELPQGTQASFQLADGTPITSSSVQGSWLGEATYTNGLKYTLNLPAMQNTGNYALHVFANNQKVGELNIVVYSEKQKELIIVPLVDNLSIIESDIKQKLDETLGEANINVNVILAPQWNDSTFTPTTTISLPTEAGLLNKYSEEQRALRDAYFDANPTATRDAHYLFMVHSFDDPNEVGYMVRGRGMGFIKATQADVLNTIAHELGHGIGALEHTWKQNGPQKDSTSNLMDYGTVAGNLIREQWRELRDMDFMPSFLDGEEDGSYVQLDISEIPSNFKNDDFTYSFATPSGEVITLPTNLASVKFSTRDPLSNRTDAEPTGEAVPIGALVGFEIFDGSINIPFAYQKIGEVFWYKNKSFQSISGTTVSAGMGTNAPPYIDSSIVYDFEVAEWTCYYDTLTKNRTSAKVILGFANYHAGEIGFNIHFSPRSTNETEVRNAYLANSKAFFAIDFDRTDNPVSHAAQWEPAGVYYANYFKSIEGTTVKIKSGLKASDLSQGAIDYLEKFSDWAAPDAITAPVVVAIAQWVTQIEALENHSLCVISAMSEFSPLYVWNQYEEDNAFNPAIYPSVQEGGGPELAQVLLERESEQLFTGIWNYHKTFYEALNQIENGFNTEVNINSAMNNSTTVSEVKTVMNQYHSENLCSYWLISGENRLDAINLLKSASSDDAAISDIIDLTITAKDNGQLYLMLDAFFSNGAQLYWTVVEKMTDGINHPRYNDFIHALLEMSILNNPENDYEYTVGFNILDLTVSEYVSTNLYNFRVETGGGNCIGGSCYSDTTIHCSPNDFVKINLYGINNNLVSDFYGDLGMSGKELIVPAFYLAYLEYNRSFQNKMFAANMLLDAFAIIAAIPTGGASLSTIGALTIGMSSANILVTVNEAEIANYGWGNEFLNLWQVIQVVDAANAIYMVGKGITKQTINGITKISYNLDEIKLGMESTIQSVKNDAESAYHLSRDAFGYVKQVSSAKGTQFYNYIVQKLDAAFLKNYKTTIQGNNFDIDVLNSHNVLAISPSGQQNILTLENNSGGTFLKGDIDDIVDNGATLMATFDNVRYRKNSSTQIDFGDLSVYKKVNGNISIVGTNGTLLETLQLKFAGKTNVLNWLLEISDNSVILSKLNALPNSSALALETDILTLKTNFSTNPDLFDSWTQLITQSNWVRTNTNILAALIGKNSIFIDRVNTFYSNLALPANLSRPLPSSISHTFMGQTIIVKYNGYGLPKFEEHMTKITVNGVNHAKTYKGAWTPVTTSRNAARTKDLKNATNWALETDANGNLVNFPNGRVRRYTTASGTPSQTKIEILDDSGTWIEQTWHHYESAKEIMPVPSDIHNPLNHSGGFTAKHGPDGTPITPDTDISEIFDYSPIIN